MQRVDKRQWKAVLVLPLMVAALTQTGYAAENDAGQHLLSSTPQPPDIRLGPLFHAVQAAKLYPDQNLCRCRAQKQSNVDSGRLADAEETEQL